MTVHISQHAMWGPWAVEPHRGICGAAIFHSNRRFDSWDMARFSARGEMHKQIDCAHCASVLDRMQELGIIQPGQSGKICELLEIPWQESATFEILELFGGLRGIQPATYAQWRGLMDYGHGVFDAEVVIDMLKRVYYDSSTAPHTFRVFEIK